MDSFRRDPGETSERGAKRPRLPAVFEAVKAGRFDELSLTSEIVAQALTFLVWELEELKKQNKTLSDQLKSNALLIDTLRQTITVTQTMTTTTTKATEATRVADAPAAPTPEPAAEAAPAPASSPPPKRRGYSVKAWENRDDLELEA